MGGGAGRMLKQVAHVTEDKVSHLRDPDFKKLGGAQSAEVEERR